MRILGRVLLGVGVFLVVAAVLALTWAPGVAKRTPLDTNSVTILDGQGARIDLETGALDPKPVYVYSLSRSDSDASSDDHILFVAQSCVVFDTGQERTCVDGQDENLISASEDIFATDRRTALSVEDPNLPADAVPHEGLVNKWPFDVEKKAYPVWDGLLGETVEADYERTETIDGLETYVFSTNVEDAPAEVVADTDGTYSSAIEYWIDPVTGAIVKQTQSQQRYLGDGTQILDIDVQWTDDTVQRAVDDAKANRSSLTLILTVVPLVGFIGGALALLVGILLLLRRRQSEPPSSHAGSRSKVSLAK
jgi:hypothetical protein